MRILLYLIGAIALLPTLIGCAPGTAAGTTTGTTANASIGSLQLSASPTTVPSDNSTIATFNLIALSSNNSAVSGALITLSTDTGILDKQTVTTDATGLATFTFRSGVLSKSNRTATITATAGAITTQYPLQITGSTVTLSSTLSSLPDNGSSTSTLSVTAKDSAGVAVQNATVSLSQSGTGTVLFTPSTGTTNINGIFSSSISGTAAGQTTISAAALGATATTSLTVTPTATTFGISQTTLTSGLIVGTPITYPTQVAMKIGDTLAVTVSAPNSTTVRFVSTLGTWDTQTLTPSATVVSVVAGTATATLSTTQAGIASVYVDDPNLTTTNASLLVAMTATTPASITLQTSPSVVSKKVGTTSGTSTLTATVTDAAGMPVGNVPVAFTILNPTGGGESISPALSMTTSTITTNLGLGQAQASFTSGTSATGATGVQVRAQVLGTAVATQLSSANPRTASGNDASIIIGGTASSIAFGSATSLIDNGTTYTQAMSVLVADSNGNPAPAGTVVNLSAWPIAWSTGSNCTLDADTVNTGTFLNEDINENLFLDTTEDGVRKLYSTGAAFVGATPGTKDGAITPTSSAGGIVSGSVTTDATGVATFNLTYGKNSAIWTVTRIRARTVVQGSESISEIKFRLAATVLDATPCKLPNSPYIY